MNGFAAELFENHFGLEPGQNGFRCQLGRNLHHPYDVSHPVIGIRSHNEIGRRQEVEIEQLVFRVGDCLRKFPQLVSGRRRGDPEAAVHGLVGSQMVVPGADSADAVYDPRHLFRRLSFDEFFEPAQGHGSGPCCRQRCRRHRD